LTEQRLTPPWPRPSVRELSGRYVLVSRLDADRDIDALYAASHGSEANERVWAYLFTGPYESQQAMLTWMRPLQESQDPLFYSVFSRELNQTIGMIAILNIVPEMGRAELGHIWYGPQAQKTRVNTETIYLFLCYLFDELHYRRVEWKCDNNNQESKRAARRLGFQYEGLFRQHMVVKGRNRDTAWFSILDSEWDALKQNFERYLASDSLSLTELNRQIVPPQSP